MATTFQEFQNLPVATQYEKVYAEGVTVSQRFLGEDTVKLCQMPGLFFVEVAYHPVRCALVFVTAFAASDEARLAPYLTH
ncbi:hypothetical protein [Hymenobacter sp. GOD-10R]|uniref:hypothetical protein n=1 Tax=Hymenobacter sp. GOD-10R TaxID=3093922 RepID=UPI002D78279F|nr:hypothetical protein [Hymenobacter sp. GOD-10R]WRQ31789.1 hypothetical protein SD425_28485 [Hymenobacter sp. GOD-10R]